MTTGFCVVIMIADPLAFGGLGKNSDRPAGLSTLSNTSSQGDATEGLDAVQNLGFKIVVKKKKEFYMIIPATSSHVECDWPAHSLLSS